MRRTTNNFREWQLTEDAKNPDRIEDHLDSAEVDRGSFFFLPHLFLIKTFFFLDFFFFLRSGRSL